VGVRAALVSHGRSSSWLRLRSRLARKQKSVQRGLPVNGGRAAMPWCEEMSWTVPGGAYTSALTVRMRPQVARPRLRFVRHGRGHEAPVEPPDVGRSL
jgi:hypothetical protein